MSRGKRVEIDWELAKKCAIAHCSLDETASAMAIGLNTLKRGIEKAHKMTPGQWMDTYKQVGKARLKMAQYELAQTYKSERMLVWLGKQWLGQKDQAEIEHTGHVQAIVTMPDNQRSVGVLPDYTREKGRGAWGNEKAEA